MSLTKERIAEIDRDAEAWLLRKVGLVIDKPTLSELCRLALLGLRVEEAPVGAVTSCGDGLPTLASSEAADVTWYARIAGGGEADIFRFCGKRVRLVVEDQE